MRVCPACHERLALRTVLNPTKAYRMLCTRCWATIVPEDRSLTVCMAVGAGVGAVLFVAALVATRGRGWGKLWWLVPVGMGIGARFFPRLTVKDPPL